MSAERDAEILSYGYNSAGHALFCRLLRDPGNIVFSPFSTGAAMAMALAGAGGETEGVFVFRLSIFVLAIFVGYYVVWSVTPALHTPLMSVTNAISSVIVVGALLAVAVEYSGLMVSDSVGNATASKIFGLLALIMASVNIFGGFLVTQRMLAMYKKKEKK
jgi:NAD(P) transhydrogenase subunit alpha